MADGLRQRLRAALIVAMKAQDSVSVSALRSGIGAIDNAEAVDVEHTSASHDQSGGIAGAVSGLGAGEVPRRILSAHQMSEVVRHEVFDRLSTADEFERAGAVERAEQLRAEAAVLAAFVDAM